MAILWEKAAHSVDHIFSLFLTILRIILVISRFGFVGWIWVLIASVSGLCIVFTFFCRMRNPENSPDGLSLFCVEPVFVRHFIIILLCVFCSGIIAFMQHSNAIIKVHRVDV